VPACLGILIGDIFRINNVKVHYTKYDELIDVIASYAEYYKASILSNNSRLVRLFPKATY